MSKVKKAVFALVAGVIAVLFTGCAGSITYQIMYDDDGGYHSWVEVVIDPDYFTAQELEELQTFIYNINEYTTYTLDEGQPEYTYLFYLYLTPEELAEAQEDSGERKEDDTYTRTETAAFFNRTIKITDRTVFYGLFDYLTGEAVPENGTLIDYALNGFVINSGSNLEYCPGILDTLTDISVEDASEIDLFFIHANNYRGFYGVDADKITKNGYNYFTWDLSGNPDKIIEYGQKVPNPAGWYTMLIIAAGLFVAGSILFIKFVSPRLAKKNDPSVVQDKPGMPAQVPPEAPAPGPFDEYDNAGRQGNAGTADPFPGYGGNEDKKD